MDKYVGPLILSATLAGLVWAILLAAWLFKRSRLTIPRKILLGFACAGVIVPAAILPVWNWINLHGSFSTKARMDHFALALWPTSIELMALDSPGPPPWSAIAFVYGFSILGNIGAYGTAGLIVGLCVRWFHARNTNLKEIKH